MSGVLENISPTECRNQLSIALTDLNLHRWDWQSAPTIGSVQTWNAFDRKSLNWIQIQTTTGNAELRSSRIIYSDNDRSEAVEISNSRDCLFDADKFVRTLKDARKNQSGLKSGNTLYYSYSTAMPLSVEGMVSILEIANDLKFEVVFLADRNMPSEQQSQVQKDLLAEHQSLISKVAVQWASLDQTGYMYRGLSRQFPSVLASINGQLQSDAYSGHKPKTVWKKWLTDSASEAKGKK